MLRFLFLFASLLSLSHATVLIGELVRKEHNVSGTVFALNTRTIRITNFYYDGLGPAGVFWLDTGSRPTTAGRRVAFRDSCREVERLRRYTGETVDLELPPDITIEDVGYFSVWCVTQKAEFGGIAIDTEDLDPILELEEATCPKRSQEQTTNRVPVREGWNCEPLAGNYQVRWRVLEDKTAVNFELVAQLRNGDQWMGFGLSGSDEKTQMLGSDSAIAYRRDDEYFAIDYHLGAQRPCQQGGGVCPDTFLNQTAGVDDVTEVSGEFKNNITVIRYTRPVIGTNPDLDKDINLEGPSFVIWAFGPLKLDFGEIFPLYHVDPLSNLPASEDLLIEFGREPTNNCRRGIDAPSEDPANIPGFERPVLYNVSSITARIGPSGGVRGVAAIIKRPAWSIAWYLSETGSDTEDILIPILGVERGKTYEFNIFGGVPAGNDDTSTHPFYITSSKQGGYKLRSPKQRANEKVFAGIEVTERNRNGGIISYKASAGALCRLETNLTEFADLETYDDFYASLDRTCTTNPTISSNGGKLTWKVAEDTPDEVYYQCVTHENLGYKIRVYDAGKVNVTELRELSGGGPLESEEEETPPDACVADFKDERIFFQGCSKGVGDNVDIFWNVDEEAGEIETLFRARKGDSNIGYVGLGWGTRNMVGSSAVIAYELKDGPKIGDYFLRGRESKDVQPNNKQKLISAEAHANDEYLSGLFTRKLVVEGLAPIAMGQTDFIWAVGRRPRLVPVPGEEDSLEFTTHQRRGPGTLDLSVRSESQVFDEADSLEAIFVVHAVFMGISWLLLVPIAITAMRFFKKYNPVTFNVHRLVNGTAAVLTIAAFIMAITSGSRTETAHLAIGSVVFSIVILQALAGVLRPHRDGKFRKPWFWGHAIVGSLLSGLGIANCFLGIGTSKIGGPVGWYIAAGVVTAVIVVAQVIMGFMPNTFPREDEEEAKARLREERIQSAGAGEGRTFVRED